MADRTGAADRDTDRFDLRQAPMRIGRVELKVRDLDSVCAFYQHATGLVPIARGDGLVTLGTERTELLVLVHDAAARPRDPRGAGLFHTAFLLPGRQDLGRWLAFAVANGIALEGASDHIVSEAIYLADPEGNGIEIYADQPLSRWREPDGTIRMATQPLDGHGLIAAAGGSRWTGFPPGGVIGHVHLQVGDTQEAERFYGGVLGFDIASRYPGASFFGSGGYHHQLAANVWNSRRAGPRAPDAAGLSAVEIVVRDPAHRDAIAARAAVAGASGEANGEASLLHDPWGTRIRLVAG